MGEAKARAAERADRFVAEVARIKPALFELVHPSRREAFLSWWDLITLQDAAEGCFSEDQAKASLATRILGAAMIEALNLIDDTPTPPDHAPDSEHAAAADLTIIAQVMGHELGKHCAGMVRPSAPSFTDAAVAVANVMSVNFARGISQAISSGQQERANPERAS